MPPPSIFTLNSTGLSTPIWRAHVAADTADLETVSSDYPALDAALPGGGWALGQLSEVLSHQPLGADWQLVLPAVLTQQRAALGAGCARWAGSVVLVNPVHPPFAPTWAAWGVDTSRLVVLQPQSPQAAAWATEQALRCADVVAVLAWLPHASSVVLRRLQYAAAQSRSLVWVFRPASAATQASPAPLRVHVEGVADADGEPRLQLRVLKRRGLPFDEVLSLPWAQDGVPQALRAARRLRQRLRETSQPEHTGVAHVPVNVDAVAVAAA